MIIKTVRKTVRVKQNQSPMIPPGSFIISAHYEYPKDEFVIEYDEIIHTGEVIPSPDKTE